MMRKLTALLSLVALCGLLPAPAQAEEMNLEQVLDSYYEAVGGKEAWKGVQTIQFKGKMAMGPGMEAPFTMTMQRPDRIRLEFTVQGMTGIQASDGETAWMVMPFMGKDDPEEMPEDMAKQIEEQADVDGELFDWEEKGHQVELLGKEEVEGTEVYKIKLTRAESGDVRYHFLDSEYFLPIKQEGKTTMQGNEIEIETAIGDYKQLCLETSAEVTDETPCDGSALIVPHSIESKPKGAPQGQVITIEQVMLNPGDVAEDYFAMPEKSAEEEEKEEPAE